jgi:hypothetical protein
LLSVYLLMSAESGQHANDLEEKHDFGEFNQKFSTGRLFSTRYCMLLLNVLFGQTVKLVEIFTSNR